MNSKNMKTLANLMRKRVDSDADNLVIVAGYSGSGKSVFASQLMFEIHKVEEENVEKKLKLIRDNIIYQPKNFALFDSKVKKLRDKSVIQIDEFIEIAYRRNALKKINRQFNILMNQIRNRNMTTLGLIPNFLDCDKSVLDFRAEMLIIVVKRGYAMVFLPDKNVWAKGEDRWKIKQNFKMIDDLQKSDKRNRLLTVEEIIDVLKESPNYYMSIKFDDLSPDIVKETYQKYKRWGGTFKPDDEAEAEKLLDSKAKFKRNMCRRLYEKDNAPKEICEITGLPISTVNSYLRDIRIKEKKKESIDIVVT